ncbi:metallophosphoesterase [Methanobrevibacter sp.]|uniref:metallophosphoesterase family protein n=1 Tax=Methanobrevibacter sp. TaxID=66852 RepID=UPI003869F5AC
MTKILAISDIHGEENENLYTYLKNNDIDLVLILGDITDFGPLEFVGTFIDKVAECDVDVIAIPGNCDPKGICNAINEVSFCLHNNIIAYGDAILFGYGGSNETPFNTPGEIQDNKIYGDVYELLANYDYVYNADVPKVKILVTHAPPYNTEADKMENGEHVGSSGILKSIHEFEPEINVCGHIHEAKSLSKIGTITDVANPGMLKDNGAVLIDVKDGSNYDISIISLDE